MALLCNEGIPILNQDYTIQNSYYNKYLLQNNSKDQLCFYYNNLEKINFDNSHKNKIIAGYVKPGYLLKLCSQPDTSGNCIDFGDIINKNNVNNTIIDMSSNNLTKSFINNISSGQLKKDCSNNNLVWDNDCFNPINKDKYLGNNYTNRANYCNNKNINLGINTNCYNFCKTDISKCNISAANYCNNLSFDKINTDPLCSNKKNDYIGYNCTINYTLFDKPECKTYCTQNPKLCQNVANDFCSIENMTKNTNVNDLTANACKNYCKTNVELCKNIISKHCTGTNINNAFCTEVLKNKSMYGNVDTEMTKYCNSEGKGKTLCTCFDNQQINNIFKDIPDQIVKNYLKDNPECYYKSCNQSTTAYKRTSDISSCKKINLCKTSMGNFNVNNLIFADVSTNCINVTDLSKNLLEKNKCIMTEWSKCSNICNKGIQTREIIKDTSNNTCGAKYQDCLIKCPTLLDQYKNKHYKFEELDNTNKGILIGFVVFIFGLFIYAII
jgi:hypothetical protein